MKTAVDPADGLFLRIPKLIEANISFQVIHGEVPSLRFAKFEGVESFYGATNPGKIGKESPYAWGETEQTLGSNVKNMSESEEDEAFWDED